MEQALSRQTRQFIIRVTEGGLSFALSGEGGAAPLFEPYAMRQGVSTAANLREAFAKSPLLSRAGLSVSVLTDAPVLLVPIEEYQATEAEEQYRYAYSGSGNAPVAATVLPALKAVALYAVERDLKTVLEDHFEEIRLRPLMAYAWEYFMQRGQDGRNKKLYACFHEDRMEVCAFSRNRFRFCNTFQVPTADDALYFLLGAWRCIGGKATADDLFLAGRIPFREALTEKAGRFLSRIFHINPAADFNRAAFTQLPGMPLDMMLALRPNIRPTAE